MARSWIDQTRPDHSTKPPHLQPPSLLCFTDMAVPSEHTPLGHSQSNQPISTSHQLYGNLIFPSRCKLVRGCPLVNQLTHTSCCCHYYSTCIHLKWRVSKNFLTFFTITFCELILIFSVHCYLSYPCQCGYLRPLTELKDTTFTPFCQQQQQSVTMRTGWEKMPFHFFNQ